MTDHTELARLAEAATKGEWTVSHQNGDPEGAFRGVLRPPRTNSRGVVYNTYVCQYASPENAAYIAAANPSVILSLLAENERLRGDRAAIRAEVLEEAAKCAEHHQKTTDWIDGEIEAGLIASAIRALKEVKP
jgi:hypothetical protein